MQVVKDRQSRCGIVISESPSKVAMIRLNDDGIVILDLHPVTWKESIPGLPVATWTFAEYWRPLMVGGHPYSVQEAARKFLRGIHPKVVPEFGIGAAQALTECLPPGEVHLFTAESGFIGRFSAIEDAQLIARAVKERPIYFESPHDVKRLSDPDIKTVLTALDPDRKCPAKPKAAFYSEVYEMSKKAAAKAPKKIQRVEASRKRADGPVAKAREIFASMKDADGKDIIAACEKAGINKGTASVQLGRWRKENGIVAKRGGVKVKKAATPKPAAKAKPKAKKKPGIPSTPKAAKEAKVKAKEPDAPATETAPAAETKSVAA